VLDIAVVIRRVIRTKEEEKKEISDNICLSSACNRNFSIEPPIRILEVEQNRELALSLDQRWVVLVRRDHVYIWVFA
jgi:hypothetical protein